MTNQTTDADGTWDVVQQDNGVVVRQLRTPSLEFLAKQVPVYEDPADVKPSLEDLIRQAASFDDLKKALGA